MNRRLRYNQDEIRVSSSFKIADEYIISEKKSFKIIKQNNFQRGSYIKSNRNQTSLRVLLNKLDLNFKITFSQCKQIKILIECLNSGEAFSEDILNVFDLVAV